MASENSAPIRVGINGFGRIGRSVFRIISDRSDMEVVGVNDLYDNEQLAYLLRFDSVMGRFDKSVEVGADSMTVEGQRIAMTAERNPAEIPWGDLGVDVVVESTGVFRHREKVALHLDAGAGKVLLTVPPKDELDAIIVMGVNDDQLTGEHRLVSNASCTTNCLAPLAKIFHRELGIVEGLMTTVHAYTNNQVLADVPGKDLRRGRAAAANIIPTTTGAAKAVGMVMPELDGKLNGRAVRVPVPDGSIVDLVFRTEKSTTVEAVNQMVEKAAASEMQGIIEYSTDPLVSSDIIGNPYSSIFDSLSTQMLGDDCVRVLSWYDNEWGYSNRVVDMLLKMARF